MSPSDRLDGLLATIRDYAPRDRPLPPVQLWQPEKTGAIDITIRRNGDWVHEGVLIQRSRMVRLFASILRLDDDGHTYLVTPQERLRISVELAPFTAVLLSQLNDSVTGKSVLQFTTNLGDIVNASQKHPIEVHYAHADAEPVPTVDVRHGLKALISRSVFHQLVDYAEQRGCEMGVVSDGCFMSLGKV